ncbi:cell division protein ZapA [Diaphorobacter ruginosibacter]|uniref:cell division protein ZapA n=1 Tax=Diaphorobacter ruginosibacter TaxID=1715720 RepID=UPI003340961E
MKQIEVKIMQQSYLLSCPEGHEARMLEAVERVDTAMTRIRDAGKVKARERIAVLAALNMAFEIADHRAATLAAETRAAQLAETVSAQQAPPPREESSGDADERMAGLIQRLDAALGDDGRLF